jgi:hypothetical protein
VVVEELPPELSETHQHCPDDDAGSAAGMRRTVTTPEPTEKP